MDKVGELARTTGRRLRRGTLSSNHHNSQELLTSVSPVRTFVCSLVSRPLLPQRTQWPLSLPFWCFSSTVDIERY